LQGEDNVGGSTHMLSYTWGYVPVYLLSII
jgi:hypothetical protein